ncbi:hypothetical protein FOPE_05959 [Fonsecaea pedrosoi]|nr:hypothetical protein FOPE_05959 [Fonsecaea pedrosoi]
MAKLLTVVGATGTKAFCPSSDKAAALVKRGVEGRFVLAYSEDTTSGKLLSDWSEVTGIPAAYVQTSLEDFNPVQPGLGLEMGIMMAIWNALRDQSWSGEEGLLTREELGIELSELTTVKDTYKVIDWDELLQVQHGRRQRTKKGKRKEGYPACISSNQYWYECPNIKRGFPFMSNRILISDNSSPQDQTYAFLRWTVEETLRSSLRPQNPSGPSKLSCCHTENHSVSSAPSSWSG